eukprot:TRINITY_DN47145_c0_g1_i1.p1 TRINITY_DN47145_c0_g1~~TRINITY_DN47145_c0_g1_i1.p1  ORF type:complete len:493 (+),score=51.20 TRINITY_DN47145_c0_g1_i1:59-1537(+)
MSFMSHGQLPILYTTVMVDTIGYGLSIPLMPFYAIGFGATNLQLGLMSCGFNFGSLVGNFVLCSLSDRLGRKPILCACLFANALCYMLVASASTAWQLIELRILTGFFSGTVACAKVYVADCTAEEDRARCLANVNVAFASSVCFGPAVGGLCALVSISFGFYAMAVVSVMNALAGTIFLREPTKLAETTVPEQVAEARPPGLCGALRTQPQILTIVLSSGMQYLAYAPLEALGALLFVQQYGLGSSQYSLLITLGGVVYVSTMKFAFVRVYNSVGGKRTAQIGHIFRGACYALWAVGSDWSVALLGFICLGLGGLITPANDTTLSLMVDTRSRGAVQGLNMATTAAARTFGPLFAVPLFGIWNGLPFCVSTLLMLSSTLVLQMLREPQPPPQDDLGTPDGGATLLTPPPPCRPLESFESLPAADPGSARPISTLLVQAPMNQDASRGRGLLEPFYRPHERRAASAPGRTTCYLLEAERSCSSLRRARSPGP